ncbi:MAG: hypothetical protein QOE77_4177 [Blastocatellia bacterium]|jgi:hypothetical protein|nr:hypothetical protein [Blastocatellia bacterium]
MDAGSYAAWLAIVGVAGIVIVGALGVLNALGVLPIAFDLDDEYTIPAFWSALLLVAFAFEAYRLAQTHEGRPRFRLMVVAGFIVYLSLDELFSIHERIDFHTGVDWQLLYVPLMLAFIWSLWQVAQEMGTRSAETMMIVAGLAAWVVAQFLEALAYSQVIPSMIDLETMSRAEIHEITDSLLYNVMSITEELLEMGGSLILAVAFARAVSRRRAAQH